MRCPEGYWLSFYGLRFWKHIEHYDIVIWRTPQSFSCEGGMRGLEYQNNRTVKRPNLRDFLRKQESILVAVIIIIFLPRNSTVAYTVGIALL